MATYPTAVYAPRTKANRTGVVYDAAKTTVGYAEDVQKLDAEVVAIETELGLLPKGTSASVLEKIKGLRSLSDATADTIIVKGDNVGIGTAAPGFPFEINKTNDSSPVTAKIRNNTVGTFGKMVTLRLSGGVDVDMSTGYYNSGDGNAQRFTIANVGNYDYFHINFQTGATGIGANNTTPNNTLLVFDNMPTYGVTSLGVRAGVAQGTTNLTEWKNNAGNVLSVINPSGYMGIGITSPTAKLHLAAGTATANTAPLKFSAGVVNTTKELGAVEFIDDGTDGHLYIVLNVGGVLTRKEIAFVA